jgi:CDP-paratose 2-epimerase
MSEYILITGGAGFIGSHLAHDIVTDHKFQNNKRVLILDNFSTPHSISNLDWLDKTHAGAIAHVRGDVRERALLRDLVRGASAVFHFAAQTDNSKSLSDPFYDLEVNTLGTLNILSALKELENPAPLFFTSSSEVYGNLDGEPTNERIQLFGIGEEQNTDPSTLLGCSKAAAEHYVLTYSRSFGLPAIVLRLSHVYGPCVMNSESHGWVSELMRQMLRGETLTIKSVRNDGKEIFDLLYIDDLVSALMIAAKDIKHISGQVFNIGGGSLNRVSMTELIELLCEIHRGPQEIRFESGSYSGQQYYVSDIRKFRNATGWKPQVRFNDGLRLLYERLKQSRHW